MRIAFKEWAVVVDALGRGEQTVILRKGGISEGRGGFQPEHGEFLLYPTQFHQQRESVIPSAQQRYDVIQPFFGSADAVRVEYFARVVSVHLVESLAAAKRLAGQHIWRDEVITERFDWGKEKIIHALAVRVFRLNTATELPVIPAYAGCKSWVELANDLEVIDPVPVLSDAEFAERLERIETSLAPVENDATTI